MQIIKFLTLILILSSCTYIGVLISKKYISREKQLKEMKNALNIFSTKVKFTYEPIPQIYSEISKKVKYGIGEIFEIASKNMEKLNAGDAWNDALDKVNTNMTKEDIEILKGLSSLLGKVDMEGQISEVELVESFLNTQIEKAEEEKAKYSKMYKTLGITVGLAVVIILI